MGGIGGGRDKAKNTMNMVPIFLNNAACKDGLVWMNNP